MQAIFETAFDAVYLVTVVTLGIIMIKRSLSAAGSDQSRQISRGSRQYLLFGIMAVTLNIINLRNPLFKKFKIH